MMNDRDQTILNVDGDEAGRGPITGILRQAGFHVQEAGTGRDALRLADARPELILLDVNLPDINGFEVCRQIKDNQRTAFIPIVHLSPSFKEGDDQSADIDQCADGYLTHPVDPKVLVATIISLLRLKATEQALRESEQRLKFHLENSPLAVIEWDADYIVFQWSTAAERIFGWKKEEMIGKRLDHLNMVYEEDLPIVNRTMERLSSGNELTIVSSNRNITRTGSVIHCIWYNSVVLDGKGKMSSVMSLVQDITLRKHAEEQVRTVLRRFYLILSSIQYGILLVTNDNRIEFANQAFCDMYGLKDAPSDLARLSSTEMREKLHHCFNDPDEVMTRLRTLIGSGRTVRGEEIDLCGERTLLCDFIPIRVGDKQYGRLWNQVEITKQKKSELELRRLYEQTQADGVAKTELLNEVNHRVKNNLMMILGLIIAEKRRAAADGQDPCKIMWGKIERRINGLLNVHQMLSDSHWKPINLSTLAERICTNVLDSNVASEPAVDLNIEPSDIDISPRQAGNLALVFNELITNCLKYAFGGHEHPSVWISNRMEGQRIRIEFKDNGCGFPYDVLEEEHRNVGLRLVTQLIEQTLDGKMRLSNDGGAVVLMALAVEGKK